jgi:hypothetical protein
MVSAGLRLRRIGTKSLLALLALLGCGVCAASARGIEKVVDFRGLRIVVPASWPVFRLSVDPHACVRFDRHALYLGRPSAVQRCPAHAVGRTEAILVSPLSARGAGAGRAQGSVLPGAMDSIAALTVPRRRVTITATWGRDPAAIRHALGVRSLQPSGVAAIAPRRAAAARGRGPIGHASAVYTGLGFDACSAPSVSQMAAWGASPYRAVGIYIGGLNMACSQVNLTAGWVSAESAAGWQFIPIYVGLQAPGACGGCAAISAGSAAAQGAAAAGDAVNQAQMLGIGPGNPIYDDMEGYARGAANTASVLAFLSGWTTQLHAEGYLSGVYSSADSGVRDLAAQWGTGYAEPDEIWFARWNDAQSSDDPSLPPGEWAAHQRLHQYSGAHDESYGGATINVDDSYLDGATAGSSTFLPDGTFVQVAGVPGLYRIAGGAPLYVADPYMALGSPVEAITQQQLDSLPAVPKDGTFLQTTTGALYRIAGGAPLSVSNWAVFGGPQPFVTIDQWDIDNIANPLAHLNAVPANGTFLTTTAGQIYRIAGGAPFRISRWHVFGVPQPSVTVDQWDIDNIANAAAHLLTKPVDGTIVEGLPSHWYWSFAGGWRQLGSATPQAIKVDDSGIPSFASLRPLPGPKCIVPRLHRLTFQDAKRAISSALCSLGQVHRPRRWGRFHRLRVYWQIPGSQRSYSEGHRVGIKMK